MINNNQQKSNTFDINSSMKMFNNTFEKFKVQATPLETKLFNNYFYMMEALPKFKKKNVLDPCPLYELFSKSEKIIYEQYDCVDIDAIKINSNKIFIHFAINDTLPSSFIDDITKNIENNAFPNCEIFVSTLLDETIDNIKLELIYSVADEIKLFNETELIDIYNSLKILNKNSDLQNKVKRMIEKVFSEY